MSLLREIKLFIFNKQKKYKNGKIEKNNVIEKSKI